VGLAAACAVASAVEALTGLRVRLKWPNDVLVGAHKVAGILAQAPAGPGAALILGIGINVLQEARDWPETLRGRAVSLAELGYPVPRETLLAAVLRELAGSYRQLCDQGFGPTRDTWRRRAHWGASPGDPVGTEVAVDLHEDGGLLVRQADGRLAIRYTVDEDPLGLWGERS
jgi:BirA family biotin operon repressor/biotin-[acetyl-CoA-carboxylase] ligase